MTSLGRASVAAAQPPFVGQYGAVKRGVVAGLAVLASLVVACSDDTTRRRYSAAGSIVPISGGGDLTLPRGLPPSGLALGRAGAVVFFTNDGQELFRLPGYSVSGYQPPIVTHRDGRRFLIRGGGVVLAATDVESRPPSDSLAGQRCAPLDRRAEIRLLTCWEPRLSATAQETSPTLEIETGSGATSVAAGTPPGMREGHWTSSYLSPDRRWIAATWSGECETTSSWLLNLSDGSQPTAVWAGISSGALGWTPDARAIFIVTAEPGCGTAGERPGVYTVRPGGPPVQIIAQQPNDSAIAFWGPEHPAAR
jgi:hypothetical protein